MGPGGMEVFYKKKNFTHLMSKKTTSPTWQVKKEIAQLMSKKKITHWTQL